MLKSLDLTGFRNYKERHFDFDRVTVFVGQNGIGKTNILEAIGFLALARSFRARNDKEVINWESEAARIVGQTDEATIEIALANQVKGGKLIKINGNNRRSIELLGHMMVVLFLPESLGLVAGAPQLRRQFLDLILIQEDRKYAYHLVQLQKVLRQRNKLLRQIDEGLADRGQLPFWDETLVEHSSYLLVARVSLLQKLNQTLSQHYETMSEKEGILQLSYRAASVSESSGEQDKFNDPSNCSLDRQEWSKILMKSLADYQYREIAAGNSLYGPQRDDFTFLLNNRPLSTFGSRGEYRSAILALKASEADFLIACNKEREQQIPLLFLLDDVYSELDEHRRGQMVKLINNHQAVITTTDISHLSEEILKEGKVVELVD